MNIDIEKYLDLDKTITKTYLLKYGYPEILNHIKEIIIKLGNNLGSDYKKIGDDVWLHQSVKLANNVNITGPCIIGENSELRPGAYIRGSVIIGNNSVIGNSTELKNAILFDGVKVPHFNYIGDSVLGYKVHFGAGSITSNVKSDESLVSLVINEGKVLTNRKKIGALVGDMTEIGCNAVLTPGTIIGRNTTIYPLVMVRGLIKENSIVKKEDVIVRKVKHEDLPRL